MLEFPVEMQNRNFREWNQLVRGVMEVWEIARAMGWERELESQIRRDHDMELIRELARIGTDCAALSATIQLRSSPCGSLAGLSRVVFSPEPAVSSSRPLVGAGL